MGFIGAIWGITGVSMLLAWAIVRLTPQVMEVFTLQLQWYHWLALVVSVVFMAYSEGYRGFQKGFSPRVAARARHVQANPRGLHVVLGPFFCSGYFHTTRRRKISVFIMTSMIVGLIAIVSRMEQPWRGIVDAGVVVGLGWGLISLAIFAVIALTNKEFDYSPELPPPSEP